MNLVDKLQVWGFEQDFLIFKDYSLGTILKVQPRDASCATDDELNAVHSSIRDFLNGLPDGLSIQFVQDIRGGVDDLLDRHSDQSLENQLADKLTDVRTEKYRAQDKAGDIPVQRLYVLLRKKFDKPPVSRSSGWKFWQKKVQSDWSIEILNPELRKFGATVQSVTDGLSSLGLKAHRLSEKETFDLIFDQWNPAFPLEGRYADREDIRDGLLLSDMAVGTNGFVIGTTHHRVISLKMMPECTFASMSEKLRNLPFDSKLFLSIDVLNQASETTALELQRRISYAMYAGKKGAADLESEAKLRDLESLLAKRVTGEEKIFSVSLNILLRAPSQEILEDQVRQVLQTVRELSGAEAFQETIAAAPIFFEFALPNARGKERARRMTTSVLADFLPVFGDWPGHGNPRILLKNRNRALVPFDPFSPTLTNFNQVVSGGSGSGKSFLTNILMAQAIKDDPKIFILDIGGSYKLMTEHLGGQYIALGADSSLSVNPFDLSDSSPEALDQKTKFMVSLVEIMAKEDGALGIGKLERSEIESTVMRLLEAKDGASMSKLKEDLLQSKEVEVQKIGKILSPWCGDSPYGKFVDRETNLQLDKKVVCFDLKGLETHPDLQAICLFIITDLIWREVQRDRTNIKFVIFDECWKILESEAGARFIASVFRTFRKYKASAIAISQAMDDFANSIAASAILPNSSVKWILKQTGGNIGKLKEILLLNEREIKLVQSLISKKGAFSEAFLVAGDDRQVVVVESTPLEYWLATTEPTDLKAIETAKSEMPGIGALELLEHLANRFPNGART